MKCLNNHYRNLRTHHLQEWYDFMSTDPRYIFSKCSNILGPGRRHHSPAAVRFTSSYLINLSVRRFRFIPLINMSIRKQDYDDILYKVHAIQSNKSFVCVFKITKIMLNYNDLYPLIWFLTPHYTALRNTREAMTHTLVWNGQHFLSKWNKVMFCFVKRFRQLELLVVAI